MGASAPYQFCHAEAAGQLQAVHLGKVLFMLRARAQLGNGPTAQREVNTCRQKVAAAAHLPIISKGFPIRKLTPDSRHRPHTVAVDHILLLSLSAVCAAAAGHASPLDNSRWVP